MEDSQEPITKLPLELVEIILLHVIWTVPDDYHEQKFRCKHLEAVRLVCRRFYESSWKAYARVAESTAFDSRSKASMQALEAMSLHPRIRPLIKKLGFVYHHAVKLEVGDDRRCSQEELDGMKMIDARWYPNVWSFARVSHQATDPLPLQTQQQVAEAAGLILLVARSLRKFGPLEEVRYYKGYYTPPRYSGIISNYYVVYETYSAYTDYAAQLGLEVLLRALAESGQSPTRLDLAMTSNQFHTFVCETPLPLVKQVMRKVEDLKLNLSFIAGTYASEGKRLNQVVLSKSNFPSLQQLTIVGTSLVPVESPDALPEFDQIPNLKSLSASLASNDPEIPLNFISRYAASTRKLVLENYTETWAELFPCLATLHLDILELRFDEEVQAQIEYEEFFNMLTGANEVILGQAANEVIITPVSFRDRVLAHLENHEEPLERFEGTDIYTSEESNDTDSASEYGIYVFEEYEFNETRGGS